MDIPFHMLAPLIGILGVMALGGWVLTTWMRVKHGYPLDGALGAGDLPAEE